MTSWENGVYLMKNGESFLTWIIKDPDDFSAEGPGKKHNAMELFEDKNGQMWIGTYYGGLFRYDPLHPDPLHF